MHKVICFFINLHYICTNTQMFGLHMDNFLLNLQGKGNKYASFTAKFALFYA